MNTSKKLISQAAKKAEEVRERAWRAYLEAGKVYSTASEVYAKAKEAYEGTWKAYIDAKEVK